MQVLLVLCLAGVAMALPVGSPLPLTPLLLANDFSIHKTIYKEAPRSPRKAASPTTYGPLAPTNATAPKYFPAPEAKLPPQPY